MVLKRYEYTVVGKRDFPYDMLRYDACWPRTAQAASRLEAPRAPRNAIHLDPTREVDLVSLVKPPTVARWQSFGWYIQHDSLREVKL